MYIIICKNCGQANKITNIRCEFCDTKLNTNVKNALKELKM